MVPENPSLVRSSGRISNSLFCETDAVFLRLSVAVLDLLYLEPGGP